MQVMPGLVRVHAGSETFILQGFFLPGLPARAGRCAWCIDDRTVARIERSFLSTVACPQPRQDLDAAPINSSRPAAIGTRLLALQTMEPGRYSVWALMFWLHVGLQGTLT